MDICDKVRIMREVRQLSQEEMAEKMGMSVTGYAKIERGQTKLHFEKLAQIAQIFNIELNDLINMENKKPTWFFGENNSNNYNCANYYATDNAIILELEKQKLQIENYQQQLHQKDQEIVALKKIIELLEKQTNA